MVQGIVPVVAVLLAVDDHHGFAVVVLLEGLDAEFVHERMDPVLGRPDPRAAAVDPRSVVTHFGEGTAADPVAGLQQRHRVAGLLDAKRGRQARETGTYHADVDVSHGDNAYPHTSGQSTPS